MVTWPLGAGVTTVCWLWFLAVLVALEDGSVAHQPHQGLVDRGYLARLPVAKTPAQDQQNPHFGLSGNYLNLGALNIRFPALSPIYSVFAVSIASSVDLGISGGQAVITLLEEKQEKQSKCALS